eukprot:TRINITY_DN9349_c0_g1_i2.p1 TRINITY_DN9349_c0_g1~~TRINITY_DN9349_c0_g1_i2.p1  ORF type:complete len:179 (-),score=37.35 TRINITY_DN9349_c0_g1_i2:3-482(-)
MCIRDSLYTPSVFDKFSCQVKVENENYTISFWESGGQNNYPSLKNTIYQNADIFIIVYSVIDPSTFEDCINKNLAEIKDSYPLVPVFILGNKIDLRNEREKNDKVVYYEKAAQITISKGLRYFECSALTQKGVNEVFEESIQFVVNKKLAQSPKSKKRS